MKKATIWKPPKTFQESAPWADCEFTMSRRLSEPARRTTPTRDRPRANSYEMTWLVARSEPKSEYLLLELQPESAMP